MALSRGWLTDLAVLRHGGSSVEEHHDHLVVRTTANPTFHWGNFVLVTDASAVDDTERWRAVFAAAFPAAEHVAIGLARLPDAEPWREAGLVVETDDVLFTQTLPEQRPLANGYVVREPEPGPEGDAEWEALIALDLAENARTAEHEPQGYEVFVRRQVESRRRLVAGGVMRWFTAVTDAGAPAASLGVVLCGDLARYQSVGTHADHRRQGLAGHLLGVAARWAQARGGTAWVIVTETTNPAGRLYRSVGFHEDAVQVAVTRA